MEPVDTYAELKANKSSRAPSGKVIKTYHDLPPGLANVADSVLAQVTLGLYVGWIYVLMLLAALSWYYRPVLYFTLALWSTVLMPAKHYNKAFFRFPVFESWRRYTQFTMFIEPQPEGPIRNSIYAEYPHGVMPIGPVIASTMIPHIAPGHRICSIAADILFWIPFYKHFTTWAGAKPATMKNLVGLLGCGSVAVMVGGVAEMFMQRPDREVIMLRNRKGFIRAAVQRGADVLPVYHFGNSQMLHFGPQCLSSLSRRLKMSLGIVYGRLGLPIPHRHRIHMVVGAPVSVRQRLDPDHPGFAAEVDHMHQAVVDAIAGLYDRHKKDFGWEDRPLEIK